MEDQVFQVAGVTHHTEAARLVHAGDEVHLVPEPTNPYDPEAIRVVQADPRKPAATLGYVPRILTGTVRLLLAEAEAAGHAVTAMIVRRSPSGGCVALTIRVEVRGPDDPPAWTKTQIIQERLRLEDEYFDAHPTHRFLPRHIREWVPGPKQKYDRGG